MTAQNPFPAVLGLTLAESRILMCILARAPQYISHTDIHGTLYGDAKNAPSSTAVASHVCYLRKKLAPYKIKIRSMRGQGYFLSEEDGRALQGWIAKARRPLPGPLDPIPIALVVTFFGERARSPVAITKMLQGEASLGSVKQVLSRARKQGRDIPTFYGGRANRPAAIARAG